MSRVDFCLLNIDTLWYGGIVYTCTLHCSMRFGVDPFKRPLNQSGFLHDQIDKVQEFLWFDTWRPSEEQEHSLKILKWFKEQRLVSYPLSCALIQEGSSHLSCFFQTIVLCYNKSMKSKNLSLLVVIFCLQFIVILCCCGLYSLPHHCTTRFLAFILWWNVTDCTGWSWYNGKLKSF